MSTRRTWTLIKHTRYQFWRRHRTVQRWPSWLTMTLLRDTMSFISLGGWISSQALVVTMHPLDRCWMCSFLYLLWTFSSSSHNSSISKTKRSTTKSCKTFISITRRYWTKLIKIWLANLIRTNRKHSRSSCNKTSLSSFYKSLFFIRR